MQYGFDQVMFNEDHSGECNAEGLFDEGLLMRDAAIKNMRSLEVRRCWDWEVWP